MLHRTVPFLLIVAGLAATWLSVPAAAFAATASETITGGSLAFINSTPANVTFPATTLNGTDQMKTASQAFDVSDARGTGAGWNITATSTTFTTGGGSPNLLATNATTIPSTPLQACDSGVTCVLPTNAITYPYSLPAAASAPAATKIYNAAANTGTGALTVTPTWRLAVPATALAGTYTSTWTLSLVSGP